MATKKEMEALQKELDMCRHASAEMAGDFSAIASMLDEADIPENKDVRGRVRLLVDKYLATMNEKGMIVVTTRQGEAVAVTRQDTEGRVLKVLWEKA